MRFYVRLYHDSKYLGYAKIEAETKEAAELVAVEKAKEKITAEAEETEE